MYYQDFQQDHGQYASYSQYHDRPYTDFISPPTVAAPSIAPNIVLDDYNSDLNFVIDRDGLTGSSLHQDGFEYMWAGARATHGVRTGKVFFEVTVLEKLPVKMPETEKTPHVVRVGWSVDAANLQLGEDNLSYGYGGTGKVSVNNKFFDYGEPYSSNDTICCYIDLDASPKVILFAKNGQFLGVAFRLGAEANGQTFFPHVTLKNMRVAINFGSRDAYFPPLPGFSLMSWLPAQNLGRGTVGPATKQECEVIMMVGLPAAGKTHWAVKYSKDHPEKKYDILGTNTIMDKMKVMGLMRKRNYHGRWDALIKQATDTLNKVFKIAERKNRNYILDQTNVYFTARRRKMNNFQGYRRIAAVVVSTNEVLKERTERREKEEGKIVPESAVLEMKANFSLPEVGETFEDVWFIEQDKANAMHLVNEFQREGKEYKEKEKKRKADEKRGPSEGGVKRHQTEQGGAPSSFHSAPFNQGPSHGNHGGYQGPRGESKHVPFQGPTPGTYGASNSGSYPRYSDYGSLQSAGVPGGPNSTSSVAQGRYSDYRQSYGTSNNYGNAPSYASYSQGFNDDQKARFSNSSFVDVPFQPAGYVDRQRSGYSTGGGGSGYDMYGQYYGQNTVQFNPQQQGYFPGGPGRGQPRQQGHSGHYGGYGGGY